MLRYIKDTVYTLLTILYSIIDIEWDASYNFI